MPAIDEEVEPLAVMENPCGIIKTLGGGGQRRFGGVLTLLLLCGVVANIQLIAVSGSATQVYGMASEIRAVGQLSFVVYDNACAFARFFRNQVCECVFFIFFIFSQNEEAS